MCWVMTPPIGTVLEYSDGTRTITGVGGMEVSTTLFNKEENKTYDKTIFAWII